MKTLFGRDPIFVLAFIAVVLQGASRFFPFTVEQQGIVLAVISAAVGVVGAIKVKSDQAVPLILGLVKAVFALLLAYKINLDADAQATILALITTGAALFTRTQVTAPLDSFGNRQLIVPGSSATTTITKSTGSDY